MIATFILAAVNLGDLFGLSIPIDANTANAIGVGVVAIANVVLTLVTSKRIGIDGLQPSGESIPSPMPSPSETRTVSPDPSDGPSMSRFDQSTRQRAEEYLRKRAGNPSDRDWKSL